MNEYVWNYPTTFSACQICCGPSGPVSDLIQVELPKLYWIPV